MSEARKGISGPPRLAAICLAVLLVWQVQAAPARAESDGAKASRESWYFISYKGHKTGYAVRSLSEDGNGYRVAERIFLRLNLGGDKREIQTVETVRLDRNLELVTFESSLVSEANRFRLEGRRNGQDLEYTLSTPNSSVRKIARFSDTPRVRLGVMPHLRRNGLAQGSHYKIEIFDAASQAVKPVEIWVEGREAVDHDGRRIETTRLNVIEEGIEAALWVDDAGDSVREEDGFGFRVERTTPELAARDIPNLWPAMDISEETAIRADRRIANPRGIRYLKARLVGVDPGGFALDGAGQKLTGDVVEVRSGLPDRRPTAPVPDLTPWLAADELIQSHDPGIMEHAKAIAGRDSEPLVVIRKVTGWVRGALQKQATVSLPSAVDVLEAKKGDCNEHTVLAVALLRALGIPSRPATGLLYDRDRFYFHAWVEVFLDGDWLAVDPTSGQVPADAARIRLGAGSLTGQTEVMRTLGKLNIEILEAD